MSAAISYQNVDVPAGIGLAVVLDVTGALFVCKEATARFEMQFDDGPRFPCEGGFTLRPPGGFTRITLFNLSATEKLTVDFYAGDTFVGYDYVRVPRTRLKNSSTGLDPGLTKDLVGIDKGNRRKAVIVTNTHASEPIQIRDVGLTEMARIVGTRSLEIETDADLQVRNAGAVNIYIGIIEIFYVT